MDCDGEYGSRNGRLVGWVFGLFETGDLGYLGWEGRGKGRVRYGLDNSPNKKWKEISLTLALTLALAPPCCLSRHTTPSPARRLVPCLDIRLHHAACLPACLPASLNHRLRFFKALFLLDFFFCMPHLPCLPTLERASFLLLDFSLLRLDTLAIALAHRHHTIPQTPNNTPTSVSSQPSKQAHAKHTAILFYKKKIEKTALTRASGPGNGSIDLPLSLHLSRRHIVVVVTFFSRFFTSRALGA
jgi:hypothetical protein